MLSQRTWVTVVNDNLSFDCTSTTPTTCCFHIGQRVRVGAKEPKNVVSLSSDVSERRMSTESGIFAPLKKFWANRLYKSNDT